MRRESFFVANGNLYLGTTTMHGSSHTVNGVSGVCSSNRQHQS